MISNYKASKVCKGLLVATVLVSSAAIAEEKTKTIGTMASTISESFEAIGKMILGIAMVAGLGFGVAAIFKFKQHKDNPTQVPVGTPVAMLAISAALVFLPSLYSPLGATMGVEATGGFQGGGTDVLPGSSGGSE